MKKITVDIPDGYLLHIATYGRMGTGEFSDLMKTWAEKECEKAGLGEKLKKLQLEKLRELRQSIRNVLGDDAMKFIDDGLETATAALDIAKEMRKPNLN